MFQIGKFNASIPNSLRNLILEPKNQNKLLNFPRSSHCRAMLQLSWGFNLILVCVKNSNPNELDFFRSLEDVNFAIKTKKKSTHVNWSQRIFFLLLVFFLQFDGNFSSLWFDELMIYNLSCLIQGSCHHNNIQKQLMTAKLDVQIKSSLRLNFSFFTWRLSVLFVDCVTVKCFP